MPSQDTDYSRFTDAQLLDMHIQDRHNYPLYEERLRREKRAERRRTIRSTLLFLVVVGIFVIGLGLLAEFFKGVSITTPPLVEAVIIWGIIGVMFLLVALGRGGIK